MYNIFFRIPYTAIRSAASHRRVFEMWYLAGIEHSETLIVLKLESSLGANTLYRALTEKHAFYSCETVRGAVTSQYIRDLKVNYCILSVNIFLFTLLLI